VTVTVTEPRLFVPFEANSYPVIRNLPTGQPTVETVTSEHPVTGPKKSSWPKVFGPLTSR
jgi:hypothetical protein